VLGNGISIAVQLINVTPYIPVEVYFTEDSILHRHRFEDLISNIIEATGQPCLKNTTPTSLSVQQNNAFINKYKVYLEIIY
jgi:hypothetical protein